MDLRGKRKREYLYNSDVELPPRTKSRYASKKRMAWQRSEQEVAVGTPEQSTSDSVEYSSSGRQGTRTRVCSVILNLIEHMPIPCSLIANANLKFMFLL